jgi:hypothetical protein
MTGAIAGWIVVATLLGIGSALILALPFAVVRRAAPRAKMPRLAYLIAVLAGAIGLWYLIPLAIHALVGRVPY